MMFHQNTNISVNMKSIFVFFTLWVIFAVTEAANNLTEEQKAKLAEFNKKCSTSSGITPDQLTKIRSGNFGNDQNVQKYFGCMLRSVGVINDAGQLQLDVLRTKIPKDMKKEDALKILMICKDKKGSDVDETAFLLYKCFSENSPNHIAGLV